jgi:hypothetical protein
VPESPHGRVAAAEMAPEFFLRFGWKPSTSSSTINAS